MFRLFLASSCAKGSPDFTPDRAFLIAKNKKLKDEELLAFHKEQIFAIYQKTIACSEEYLKEKKEEANNIVLQRF